MSDITLTAADGFELGAYKAMPEGEPKGAVVVIQEIFGVNAHIREVADGYATAGYVAIAPALFDRQETNVQLGYADEADWGKGMRLAFEGFGRAAGIADMQAAVDAAGEYGNVGLVGYCFGGLMAWIAADEVSGLAAVSGYYGGMIGQEANRKPACPVILHFGEKDAHIPAEQIDLVRQANPQVEINMYDADHGFNCDHRDSYDAAAAEVAKARTLEFFAAEL